MAEFHVGVEQSVVLAPVAFKGDQQVKFPSDTVFTWSLSDPSQASLDDPSAFSPNLTGLAASDPNVPLTVSLNVVEGGFLHNVSHQFDIVEIGPSDTIDTINFTVTSMSPVASAAKKPSIFQNRKTVPGRK